MKIKIVFSLILALLGITAQFTCAMEIKGEVKEDTCPGKIILIAPTIRPNIVKFTFLKGKDYIERTAILNKRNGFPSKSNPIDCRKEINKKCAVVDGYSVQYVDGDKSVELKKKDDPSASISISHSTPIVDVRVTDNYYITASYNEKSDTSTIKFTPITQPIIIKTSDDVETDATVEILNFSEYLSEKLQNKKEIDQVISLSMNEKQFEIALECMQKMQGKCAPGALEILLMQKNTQELCDLILANEELLIKDYGKIALTTKCLEIIKTKFDQCKDEPGKQAYFTQVERLLPAHQREIAHHIAKYFISATKNGKSYEHKTENVTIPSKPEVGNGTIGIIANAKNLKIIMKMSGNEVFSLPHDNNIRSTAISNTSKGNLVPQSIITASLHDVTVWNYDVNEYKCKKTLQFTEVINSIDITQDGKYAVIANGTLLEIWDLEADCECLTKISLSFSFSKAQFSNDGNRNILIEMNYVGKKFELENFFNRIELIKKLDVRSADFVNMLSKKAQPFYSMNLSQKEHEILDGLAEKDLIKKAFNIADQKVETISQEIEIIKTSKDNAKQQGFSLSSFLNTLYSHRYSIMGSSLLVGAACLVYFYSMNH